MVFLREFVKPKSKLTPKELVCQEEEKFNKDSLSILAHSVKSNIQVLINCRNKKNYWVELKHSLPHCPENVKEMWKEVPGTEKGKKKVKPLEKDRFISKMSLRGDSVILVLLNPLVIAVGK